MIWLKSYYCDFLWTSILVKRKSGLSQKKENGDRESGEREREWKREKREREILTDILVTLVE